MKKIITLITIFMIPVSIFAHSLLLNVFDNEDNTITVEGIFNTGESASGAYIILENTYTSEVLYKKRLPSSSELTIKIPDVKYKIILDGGPGHQVVKEGIAPINGFKKLYHIWICCWGVFFWLPSYKIYRKESCFCFL